MPPYRQRGRDLGYPGPIPSHRFLKQNTVIEITVTAKDAKTKRINYVGVAGG